MSREPRQNFDILVVDAFSGDAIPVHLLTREAFALYWRHLKPNGVLAVHVSNRYLVLPPVVKLAARQSGKSAWLVDNADRDLSEIYAASYVLVTSRDGFATGAAAERQTAADFGSTASSRMDGRLQQSLGYSGHADGPVTQVLKVKLSADLSNANALRDQIQQRATYARSAHVLIRG